MLIQCTIAKKPREITLDGKTYNFLPLDPENPDSPKVASVNNDEHIARLLSISEGYKFFKAEPGDNAAEVEEDPVRTAIEPVTDTTDTTDATTDSDTPEDDTDGGEDALVALLNDPTTIGRPLAETAFAFLFDRAPNGNAHTDTIIKKVIEKAAEAGWLAEGDDAAALIAQVEEADAAGAYAD
jgi:hypothetical protein